MKVQKIHSAIRRTAFKTFVLVLTAVMLITSGTVNAQTLDCLQAMNDLAQQTFTLTPEDGVTVELSGMMPVNGSASATPAGMENEDVLHAYDITIRYQDGHEFEPESENPISVSFQSDLIADALEDDAKLDIAHIPDDGKEESVALTGIESDTVSFDAESFSVYLIRTHRDDPTNHNPRRIYHFLSPDFSTVTVDGTENGAIDHYRAPAYEFPNKLNDMATTQAIRSGESLQEIVHPRNDNSGLFYGWYIVESDGSTEDAMCDDGVVRPNIIYHWGTGTPQHVLFNEPINFEATEDEDIYLAPLFGRYRFLTFHQDTEGSENENIIVSRKLIVLNDERKCELEISDVRAPSTDPNKIIFWGWRFTHTEGDSLEGETEIHQTVTTEGEEIEQSIIIEDQRVINGVQPTDEDLRHMIYDVWPIFKEARWVEFDVGGQGASYRPPQFILLEDDTTGFNNVPTRHGYDFNGWYYNTENNENIMVTDGSANILSGVNRQLTTGMRIENGKLVITSDAEGSSASRVFHAKWTPVTQADFHVIVWKQKVTDTVNSGKEGYPAKTYDFAGYFPLEGETLRGATGTDPRQTTAYTNYEDNNRGFEDFNLTRNNQNADNNFIGFHFDHATVSDSGYNHPTYEGTINPDGSTVVNVYYDRDVMKVTFHYKSAAVSGGTTSGDYVYLQTSDNTGEQYGVVGGEYVPLSVSTELVNNGYTFSKQYTKSTAENTDMYGIVGGEYVKLTREEAGSWKKTGNYYVRYDTPSTQNPNGYYYLHDSAFKELRSNNPPYYNSNKWYRSRSGWLWYSYSDQIMDAYQKRTTDTGAYTGTRYIISNSALQTTTSNSNSPQQYGKIGDDIYEISYTHDYYYYTYNGVIYNGDRYTMAEDNTFYTGTLYRKTDNGFVATTDDSGTVYGTRTDSVYEELTKQGTTTVYTWTTPDGSEYTSTRYLRFRKTSDTTFPYEVVWEGLYGRSFAQNGYAYPTQYSWNEQSGGGGTTQTLLSSFTMLNSNNTATNTDYHLYYQGNAGTTTFYHLCQQIDGTYTLDDPALCIEAHSNGGTFTFTNKFNGFIVTAYSRSFSETASGATAVNVNGSASSSNFTYVYHRRRKDLELMFDANYNGGQNHSITGLYYGQSIAGYSDVYEPAPREHYFFGGWYEDVTCTKEFNFDTTITASKIIYAKWTKERYRVMVDPNGGELPLGSTNSTFFNVDFDELVGEYADIRRAYVEDSVGDYVYANFQYNKVNEFPGVAAQPKGLAAVYRKAFYIKKNEIDAAYSRTFTVNGVDYSYANSGMTLEEFKSCIDMNTLYKPSDGTITYELVSWHRVREDGTVEQIPFNFKNQLTEDTTIRARWVQHGGYSLSYDPTMVTTGVTGTMDRVNDPLDHSRKYADKAPVIILGEPIDIRTTGAGGQEADADDYTFRGWHIVNANTHQPMEEGVFYDPGETMILDAKFADHAGVIHMEAYYEKRASTVRRPDVAALTLDANSSTASVNGQELAGDKKEYADVLNSQVKIERQINNYKVDLYKYIRNFTNSDGSLLLGWNTTREAGTYIPEYYADAEIGVNKQGASSPPNNINTLYAVWEPMVYLTLDNTTTQSVSFNLTFNGYGGTVYTGYVNTMTGVYERTPFSDEAFVTKNSSGNFEVTLPANTSIQLVVPEGVLTEGQPGSYTITGDYARSNSKSLYVYNSGATDGVSIVKSGSSSWYYNGQYVSANPIPYTTTGTLIKGSQGRLVRFTEENASIKLNLTARYYDLEKGQWKDADNDSDVNEETHFLFSNNTATETITDHGATTSVKLIDVQNHTTTFGMNVTSYNSNDYKFIGWYMTPSAAPNAYSVDGHASDFGAARVEPSLAIPPDETTYYALFVPYIKGDLTITHSQRADSAGDCADENGVGLRVHYYTAADKSNKYLAASDHGDKTDPATVTLHDNIIDEKNTAGHLVVSVRAKPNEDSTYKATYRNQIKVPDRDVREDDLEGEGFFYAEFDAPVSERFVDSDTVKGLKELRTVNYYSIFSRAFEIIYTYTARDGLEKQYKLTGSEDSFEDFEVYVIEHTPYVRTLAGDTVWDTDNISMYEDETGMHAFLNEVSDVRDHCTVKIIEKGGYTPTVLVPYGENFTEEQAQAHLAPETNDAGQVFDYWDIMNTDTGEHIANCYDEKFTFKVWNNYTITPHYTDVPTVIHDEGTFITIDYIDTSRNPWGDAVYNNDADTTDRSGVTDKVVADVDISFINNGDKILDALDENGKNLYKLGVMFEICGTTEDGGFDAGAYKEGEAGMASRVATLVGANTKPSSTATIGGVNCYFTKIDINENTVSTFNRSEFTRSFTTSSVKNRVFRMYAYMVTPEGTTVLSKPYYLSLYDYASPEYALPHVWRVID